MSLLINDNYIRNLRKELKDKGIHKVVVALSGGPDSVALTNLLNKSGIQIVAMHCNFHLRGEESNRDQDFTGNFCKILDIPLLIKQININEYLAENPGISIEMACRETRYEWFHKVMKEEGAERIAIGHNADDNIETFFLNLLRGSGTQGLKGMSRDNGILFRPLLDVHRDEIISYLEENNLSYIVDSSNLRNDYRRNYLRNEIIPLFKKEWKGFNKSLDSSISYLNSENKIIEEVIKKSLPANNEPLETKDILDFADPVLLIRRYISEIGPFTTTAEEILNAINAKKPHIRKWRLKKGSVRLQNGRLFKEYD